MGLQLAREGMLWFDFHDKKNSLELSIIWIALLYNSKKTKLGPKNRTSHETSTLPLNTLTALVVVLTGQIKVPFRDRAYQCLVLWVLSPRNPAGKPRWKSFSSEFEIFEGSRQWKRERGGVAKKLLFLSMLQGNLADKATRWRWSTIGERTGGTHGEGQLAAGGVRMETSGASTGGAGAWRPHLPQHPGHIHTPYSQSQHTCVFVTASHDNNESV